ncbi:MAG: glycosyltransferase, partial [Bacteroidota bacterium]
MNSNKDIAILIPFRNEEKNLGQLLTQIDRIGGVDYANVFLIDDHSTDDSLEVIRAHSMCGKLKILSCQESVYGKKRALEKGVIESGGKWILSWDCDIQLEKFDWMVLEELISNNVELAVLPVRMKSGNGFFELFQQAEWRILQYWTFLALRCNQPIMANGANLFFTSNLFLNQPQRNYLFSSGDDMNMLHEAIQVKGKIEGVDLPSNAINIYPVDSLATYCQQRWRWAGKIRKYPITCINYMYVLFSIWNF